MVYHLTLEARRTPAWATRARRDQHSVRLRTALGGLARSTTVRWHDDCTCSITLRYDLGLGRDGESHQDVLAALIWAAGMAGMRPVRATVARVASHWTQGAIAGAVTGVGLSRTQQDEVAPLVALAAIAMGAIVGSFVRRDVPVLRAVQLPRAGWRLIPVEPEVSGPRFRVGLA